MKRGPGHPPLTPYLFLAPFLIIFLVFVTYPLFYSIPLALQQTFGPARREYVGFANFTYLFTEPRFWIAVRNTFLFAAGSLFIQLPISLSLALLLNRPDIRGRAFFRLIYFSPALVGTVFVAVIFALIFEKRTGLLNEALHTLTAGAWDLEFPWLQEYVMAAMILAALWIYAGFNMVYFLAALQNVPQDLLEAAKVDGANAWHRFLHVTVPAIRPVASFVILLSLIGSMQFFELPWVLFNGPGPNDQALFIVTLLYQEGFETSRLGRANAIGWLLAVFLFFCAMVQRQIAKRSEY